MKARKIWDFLFELISFGSPRAIVINLTLILVILAIVPMGAFSYVPSVFKEVLLPLVFKGHCPDSGVLKDCNVYSTGETRALSRLMHGDLQGAASFNKLIFIIFPLMITLIVLNLIRVIKKKNNL